jgi:hypothetical protein
MEVKLLKDIRNYSENIFFGLSLRQFVFAALAVGSSVAAYFLLKNVLSGEAVGWICILAALPFAFLGFFKYQGLSAEQFLGVAVRYLFAPTKLPRVNQNIYYEILTKGRNLPI